MSQFDVTARGHIQSHASLMKAQPCCHLPSSLKTRLGQAPLSYETPLVQHGAPSASPLEHETVRWVRHNEEALIEEMSPSYLHVRQGEDQDSRQ